MRALFQASVLAVLLSGAAIPSAPALAAPAASPAPREACVAGAWAIAETDPSDTVNSALPLQMQSEHFALHWKPGTVAPADAQAAVKHLEYVWDYFIATLHFPEPHCGSAAKFKVNAYIGTDYGLTGGADSLGHMGMWIGPGALRDRFGLAHELTHALQTATGHLMDSPYTGWMFESHANWMTVQLPEFRENTHCSVLLKQYPHLYYGSTRSRYCNWQFLEFLKDTRGFDAVNDIWRKAPGKDDPAHLTTDPFTVLRDNKNWTQSQLNDTYGDWALHNANWDYTNPDGSDQGAVFRRNYGSYDQSTGPDILSATVLDPIDLEHRRFAVPEMWAPQRWGYNVVKLHPDAGRDHVTVTFRGVVQQASAVVSLPGLADEPETIPPPASDWRWGVVAVGADGRSRYTPLQRGDKAAASIAVRPGDTGLYLVVMATPSQMQKIRWDQPWYSIYRYPWMVQLDGAMPDRWQDGAPGPIPGGHRHGNGGGWVGPQASVAASAYVGPYARVISGTVSGKARIEDHAVVLDNAQVLDEAVISGLTVLRGDTVLKGKARAATSMLGIGEYEKGIVLSGTAQNIGDVEQRGGSASTGVFYGFVDADTVKDPGHGAELTAPVPEVTAKPAYRWIP
ncbi:Svx/AvrXca family virulence/avirulence protein [Novosphingobium sp. RL4]|uniref:Svx/AvrXca family virulence/avirulence protein n=1 Tax=Novosphingobium sp. RL4 TaxID=3109595 RepID=UPI002D79F641|nr:Svx/AvrXca family virulence/avirulence protein [Novosphingobium sp. RL4]WRT95957.1 Svx/AvrXca family virulence/avirulence protein [Novosphingobium sp. RL4]